MELRFLASPFSITVTFIALSAELFAPLIMKLTLIKLFYIYIYLYDRV